MALNVTETQGTKAYLVATSVSTVDAAAIATAISGGKEIACILDIGDISLGSKAVQEFSCMNTDETYKSLGSISLANIAPQLLYDAADVAGQDDLRDMWDNNTRRKLIIVLDDQITPTTGNPTYVVFETAVSQPSLGVAKDNAVMYNPTLEITTKPILTVAT